MRNLIKNRKGYAMAYVVLLIGVVGVPMLILSVEIARAMYVEGLIQAAVDAACEASVNAVDVPFFLEYGELRLIQGDADTLAQNEFASNVSNSNIVNYNPSLAGLIFLSPTLVECHASASLEWLLPGIPGLTVNVDSLSQVKAQVY